MVFFISIVYRPEYFDNNRDDKLKFYSVMQADFCLAIFYGHVIVGSQDCVQPPDHQGDAAQPARQARANEFKRELILPTYRSSF